MATDGRDVMSTNYTYSKKLFLACARAGVSFIYASSASVYGLEGPFCESGEGEQPLNAYAYSKFLFDRICWTKYVIALTSDDNILGFKFSTSR